jgi:Na+-driven multidrug efflux pump
MNFLVSVANTIMSFGGMLAGDAGSRFGEQWKWLDNILNAINEILLPLLIVVGSAGTIYSVILGVNMARADSTEKREEAKKRLINVVVGIAITIGLILFFKLLIAPNGILDLFLTKPAE